MYKKTSKGILPVHFKSGFYIEIFNKGDNKGMKIRSESKKEMEEAALSYRPYKNVVILGEFRNDINFNELNP